MQEFPVAGQPGVRIDMETGTFNFIGIGYKQDTKYYLQFHQSGLIGAMVIGSDVANLIGLVYIKGKLEQKQLDLLEKNEADFIIGEHVMIEG